MPHETYDSLLPIKPSFFDTTSIPGLIPFQLTGTSFGKARVHGKVLKGKRNPTQNIFLKGSDLKGITLCDLAILTDSEETKFGLVLIYSCDIATKRDRVKICYDVPMDLVNNADQDFDNCVSDFTAPSP